MPRTNAMKDENMAAILPPEPIQSAPPSRPATATLQPTHLTPDAPIAQEALKVEVSLGSLASEYLAAANGVPSDAIVALEIRLAKDTKARKAIAAEAIADALRMKIFAAHRNSRGTLIRAFVDGRSSVKSLATGLFRTLLDFPLQDGKTLREASQEDLDRAIDRFRKQADSLSHTANWLTAIRNMIPAQGVVGDVIDDETATRLFNEATQ